jgi:hypothetical protein
VPDASDALPTIFYDDNHVVLQTKDEVSAYLKQVFDLDRLNNIHSYLWMAGRPFNAQALHRQKMMGRRIMQMEKADLHLLHVEDRLFVMPLPVYLLNHKFWLDHICTDAKVHKSACGFLLSYIWLIRSPLDFTMATADGLQLLPQGVTWLWWKTFVTSFLSEIDAVALDQVNMRYHFGELRLGRINSIYRVRHFFTHFIRGYLYSYNRYVAFFQRNFGWILVVFVYFSLVLSAMQVGVAVAPLDTSEAFKQASYGFVVFSIVAVAAVVAFVAFMFISMFFFNMVVAIHHVRKERSVRELRIASRKGPPTT